MKPDLFAEAREAYTIFDAWQMLRLPGEPKASCKSPFRDEKSPSFTIFDDGKAWKDHATGDGGDVIEFIRFAIGGDHRAVRDWLKERIGIDYYDHGDGRTSSRPAKAPEAPKVIEWPAERVEGTVDTWRAFSVKLGIPYIATKIAVQAGILRFTKIDGIRCFAVTDAADRAAEIRRIDGGLFNGKKAYPLKGVDKAWLPGIELVKVTPKSTGIFLTEGPKDYLAAVGLYSTYRRDPAFTVHHIDAAPSDAIYIGRANPRRGLAASPFANPFTIGKDGDRSQVIEKYRQHLADRPELIDLAAKELTGKHVSCWCKPEACHGDVIEEAVRTARRSWVPAAVLGASCTKLHPELVPWFRGRRVRMVPDGDDAGDKMGETWKALLLDLGCTVDLVKMPRGKDLFDLRAEIQPEGLFQ
jgi:hypothetical protein